ncbi:hypothetical protein H8356DRAFT_1422362 [Neocallimastix lanati (nom. inval.)]|nr:hypothetical protein H8356DRAFT_1422362 [Neocallimastix sp. JGI-2020a]
MNYRYINYIAVEKQIAFYITWIVHIFNILENLSHYVLDKYFKKFFEKNMKLENLGT